MKQTRADFGGISYTTGDFHTPGTSGLGSMSRADFGHMGQMGFSLNDAFKTVFGENAEQVKANLQAGASSMAQQQISTKLQTDPNAKQGIIDTTKAAVGAAFKEYWYITVPVTAFTLIALGSGAYNFFKARK